MPLPSLRVMTIAAADPSLFESLMRRAGFRLARRNTDPMNTQVQEESVRAVASTMMEGNYFGVKLDPYRRKLKTLAEHRGYVVMIENCGPTGSDPCEGDEPGMEGSLPPDDMGGEGPPDMGPEGGMGDMGDEMGGGAPLQSGPPEDMAGGPNEVDQIASLPLGTELAAQILAVIQGKGVEALDEPDMGEPGMEMMTDDEGFDPEGGGEMPPMGGQEGPAEDEDPVL